MIQAEITLGKDYFLRLKAKNMNELINEIIKWQDWESQPLKFLEEIGELEEHRNSGWYYFKKE